MSIMKLLQTPLQNHNSNEEISVVGMGMGGDLSSEACEELHLIVNFSSKLPFPEHSLDGWRKEVEARVGVSECQNGRNCVLQSPTQLLCAY